MKITKNLSYLFNQFVNFSQNINDTPENMINYSMHYDINQLQTLNNNYI